MSQKTTAIVVQQTGEAAVAEASVPKLRDDYLLIKVHSVSLNPTDWKHIDFKIADPGSRIGCDYAGTVEAVGSKVTKAFKKGDRVCGFCHGGNSVEHDDGAFANVIAAKGDVQIKIPDNLSFEEASTLGVGITTVGQALYQSLKLPLPNEAPAEKETLLIYGGSTATGALAIQYAKLSGFEVVATASPRNNEYLKSLGADAVFDYNSPSCSSDIKKSFPNIKYAFDCIAEDPSTDITVAAMSPSGGVYSTLLPVSDDQVFAINEKVRNQSTLGYTVVGEAFKFLADDVPAKPEDFEFGKKFWELSAGLLRDGKIKVHKPSVNKYGNGFEGILKGLQALREGKVSGEKLTVNL